MRKTALFIIFTGLVFVFVNIGFMGFDVLLDPVGYLLVFNGLWGLSKKYKSLTLLKMGVAFCIATVAISVLQLLLPAYTAIDLLMYVLQGIMFACLVLSVSGVEKLEGMHTTWLKIAPVAALLVFELHIVLRVAAMAFPALQDSVHSGMLLNLMDYTGKSAILIYVINCVARREK